MGSSCQIIQCYLARRVGWGHQKGFLFRRPHRVKNKHQAKSVTRRHKKKKKKKSGNGSRVAAAVGARGRGERRAHPGFRRWGGDDARPARSRRCYRPPAAGVPRNPLHLNQVLLHFSLLSFCYFLYLAFNFRLKLKNWCPNLGGWCGWAMRTNRRATRWISYRFRCTQCRGTPKHTLLLASTLRYLSTSAVFFGNWSMN